MPLPIVTAELQPLPQHGRPLDVAVVLTAPEHASGIRCAIVEAIMGLPITNGRVGGFYVAESDHFVIELEAYASIKSVLWKLGAAPSESTWLRAELMAMKKAK